MLILTSLLLATSLGSDSPLPSKPSDPPPCATANIPACLPGYRPQCVSFGRTLLYSCEANYVTTGAVNTSPPPAPPAAINTSPSPAPPQPQATASSAVASPPPSEKEGRGQIALVIMPGVSAYPAHTGMGLDETKAEGQIAVEFRGTVGGARIRLTGEWTDFGKIGELSFKYDFFDGFFFRPFLALGLGVASINPDAGLRAAGSAAAGVDWYISRDFFLTGELKGRVFTEGTRGAAHGLVISNQRQVALLAGMGFYF